MLPFDPPIAPSPPTCLALFPQPLNTFQVSMAVPTATTKKPTRAAATKTATKAAAAKASTTKTAAAKKPAAKPASKAKAATTSTSAHPSWKDLIKVCSWSFSVVGPYVQLLRHGRNASSHMLLSLAQGCLVPLSRRCVVSLSVYSV